MFALSKCAAGVHFPHFSLRHQFLQQQMRQLAAEAAAAATATGAGAASTSAHDATSVAAGAPAPLPHLQPPPAAQDGAEGALRHETAQQQCGEPLGCGDLDAAADGNGAAGGSAAASAAEQPKRREWVRVFAEEFQVKGKAGEYTRRFVATSYR